jgi:hypothetical protein
LGAVTTVELAPGTGTPTQAASIQQTIDPFTGLTSRRTVMVVPGEGTVEILGASPEEASAANAGRLYNLSTRARVTPDSPLILGFAIAGTEPRSVLIRAVGPGLAQFGVEQPLQGTRLELRDVSGKLVASNQGWANAATLFDAAARTGAFPLTANSSDSAVLTSLPPGNYTLQVIDAGGSGGVGLAEIYDAGTGSGSRLVNVSSLGTAGTGSNSLISGFIIAGGAAERVLLRGVGPGLVDYKVGGFVADPSITVFDGQGRSMGGNDNWVSSIPTVRDAAVNSGAFRLGEGSKDAAVLATLPTGAYTIQVSAGAGTSGAAMLEIYEVGTAK